MVRLAFVALLSALFCLFGFHSLSSARAEPVAAIQSSAANSPAFAFLADRTTASIHQLNLVDYTDTPIATDLGTIRGMSLSSHRLYVFNDAQQLYRFSFDQTWNPISSDLLGTLDTAGHYGGNAIYAEGSDLYTAGPCGIGRFDLSDDPPFLRFKDIVAHVNAVSFTRSPAGTLFLVDTETGILYQVGATAGHRDWSTLKPYKQLKITRAASLVADSQGNLLMAVSNFRLVSAPPLCGDVTPDGGAGTTPPPDVPEGVSFILRLDAATKQESIFWYGLPLDFDPPTQGVVGLAANSQVIAAISKIPFVAGSKVLLFSQDGRLLTFWGYPEDQFVAIALTSGNIATAPDFSISCTPMKNAIAAGQNAEYALTINPVGGWNNAVDLSIDGLPAGATAQFSAQTIPDGGSSSTLSISTTESSHKGSYTLTITATVITRNPTAKRHRRTTCKLRIL